MQPKGKTGRADVALNLNGQLYTIEKHHKTASVEERYQARQEQILMQTVWLMARRLTPGCIMLPTCEAAEQLYPGTTNHRFTAEHTIETKSARKKRGALMVYGMLTQQQLRRTLVRLNCFSPYLPSIVNCYGYP